ncbi:endonuclease/exonuclease/phosphatase family protein [Actinomyces faecalis]|uniref:endonuclease/exonuclease/phosphatase family protein n=1 Tax=Actinomyces faecalis TaxID=2722820 RepID=UPI001551C9E0|nr:endonuclease/exonuclease/phosphatase family protein [Actinomyces faecalis]
MDDSHDEAGPGAPLSWWRRTTHLLGWVVTAVICGVGLLSLAPDLLGGVNPALRLSTRAPFTQVLAVRSALVVLFAAVGLVFVVLALVGAWRRSLGRRRAVIAVVLVLVAGTHAWVLADRGLHQDDDVRPAVAQVVSTDPNDWGGNLKVLSFNTFQGRAKAIDLALEMRRIVPDVVVLLEATEQLTDQLLELTGQDGFSFTVFTAGEAGSELTTTVLTSAVIGPYEQHDAPGMGHGAVYLTPAGGSELQGHLRPTLLGVHTVAPLPSTMDLWASSVEEVIQRCQLPEAGLVVAGDVNATLDHAVLRDLGGCVDAGVQGGVGGLATWPTSTRTAWFGATIDHVLVDRASWRTSRAEVVEVAGSDHRALVVDLTAR